MKVAFYQCKDFPLAWPCREHLTSAYGPQDAQIGPYNFLRKTASDYGWDWGPAFVPSGINGPITVVAYSLPHLTGNNAILLERLSGIKGFFFFFGWASVLDGFVPLASELAFLPEPHEVVQGCESFSFMTNV